MTQLTAGTVLAQVQSTTTHIYTSHLIQIIVSLQPLLLPAAVVASQPLALAAAPCLGRRSRSLPAPVAPLTFSDGDVVAVEVVGQRAGTARLTPSRVVPGPRSQHHTARLKLSAE